MAKGGGKPKGRPRKITELISPQQSVISAVRVDVGESSHAAESRRNSPTAGTGTVDLLKQKIELEIQNSVLHQNELLKSEEKKEADAQKIEESMGQPLRRRGMALGYVAPTLKQGIPTAKLCMTEIEKEEEKWKFAAILYVIGESPTISYLKSYLQQQCGFAELVDVLYHNDGYFLIKFASMVEKNRLLFEGPYMLANRPVIVKEWKADFCLEKEILKEIPLWIRLPNLPLNCWSGDSLSRIGSVIGKPICADECTSQQNRVSYARLLIEIDITKPLVYKIPIEGENGMVLQQQVYYEWVPLFCPKCHKVGHICPEKKQGAGVQHQQLKQWMPKDKGKEPMEQIEEGDGVWHKPRNPGVSSIQVGNIQISTDNVFQGLNKETEGGDLFPNSIT